MKTTSKSISPKVAVESKLTAVAGGVNAWSVNVKSTISIVGAVLVALTAVWPLNVAFGANLRSNTPKDSFLIRHANSVSDLVHEIGSNPRISKHYARLYGKSSAEIVSYLRHNVRLVTLKQDYRHAVYCVTRSGVIFSVIETMPKGSKVFALADGQPILRWVCGNPFTSSLPTVQFTAAVKRHVTHVAKKLIPAMFVARIVPTPLPVVKPIIPVPAQVASIAPLQASAPIVMSGTGVISGPNLFPILGLIPIGIIIDGHHGGGTGPTDGGTTGGTSGNTSGSTTGSTSGTTTGSTTGDTTGSTTGTTTGSTSGSTTGSTTGDTTGSTSGTTTGSTTGDTTGSTTGDTTGTTTGDTTGSTSGTTTGSTTGDTTGSTSGTTTGSTTGDTSGSTSGTTTGSTTGDTTGSTSGTTAGSTTGDTSGLTSGTTTGDTSGFTSGTTSGDTMGSTSGTTGVMVTPEPGGNTLDTVFLLCLGLMLVAAGLRKRTSAESNQDDE